MLFKLIPITLLASMALGHAHAGLQARHGDHSHGKPADAKNATGPVDPIASHVKFNGTDESTTTSTRTTTNTKTATVTLSPSESPIVDSVPEKVVGACKKPVTIYKDVVVTTTATAGAVAIPSSPVKAPLISDGSPAPAPLAAAAPSKPVAAAPSLPPAVPSGPSYGAGPKAPPKDSTPPKDTTAPKESAPFPVRNGTASALTPSHSPAAPSVLSAPSAPLVTDPAVAAPTTFATLTSLSSSSYESWPLPPAISEAPPASSAQPAFVEPSGSWLQDYSSSASESIPAAPSVSSAPASAPAVSAPAQLPSDSASAPAPSSSDSVVVVVQTVSVVPVPATGDAAAAAPAGKRRRAVRKRV